MIFRGKYFYHPLLIKNENNRLLQKTSIINPRKYVNDSTNGWKVLTYNKSLRIIYIKSKEDPEYTANYLLYYRILRETSD